MPAKPSSPEIPLATIFGMLSGQQSVVHQAGPPMYNLGNFDSLLEISGECHNALTGCSAFEESCPPCRWLEPPGTRNISLGFLARSYMRRVLGVGSCSEAMNETGCPQAPENRRILDTVRMRCGYAILDGAFSLNCERHIKQIKENKGWRTTNTREGYGRWR